MPGLDLSSLNAQELRNILEAARTRNQPQLTQEVLSELQSRRTRAGRVPWRVLHNGEEEADEPEAWWADLRQEAVEPEFRPRGRWSTGLAILAAVMVSGGLGWWLSPRSHEPHVASTTSAPAAPVHQKFNRYVET